MGELIRTRYKKYINSGLLKLEDKIPPSEIGNRLSRAEVVIIPSNNDNLPYVVFEMMALGKIVLVSKQGGQSEVVSDALDGFIFDHQHPASFSKQLKKILELGDEERKRISRKAMLKVEDTFGPEAIYPQKIKVVEEMLTKKNVQTSEYPFIRSANTDVSMNEIGDQVSGKLSVVVPYFNMGLYIDYTIQSLLRSDYRDMEIIIVNDGTTDPQSLANLDLYRNNPSIRVVDSKNRGLANARNLGATMSTGEWLAFLDADDTVQPTYYSRAITVMKRYKNVHFVGCWTQYFENSKKIWPAFQPEPPLILFHNLINSSALVYKRASFLKGGKNDSTMTFPGLEDYESVVSLLSSGLNGVVLPETQFNYRVRSNSMIRAISKEKKILLYQHISKKHHAYFAQFSSELFNLSNANGPAILLDNPSLDHHLADKIPFGGKAALNVIRLIKKNRYAKNIAYKIYRLLNK